MDENKWHHRIMHLTSFSLGIIVAALAISKGLFVQIEVVLSAIFGAGLTVTITLNVEPSQFCVKGVTL